MKKTDNKQNREFASKEESADPVLDVNKNNQKASAEKKYNNAHSWVCTDKKFITFLLGDLFTSGLQVWWLVGLFSIVLVAFIFLVFFASIVDTHDLRDTMQRNNAHHRYFSDDDNWHQRFALHYPEIARLARLAQARHVLGNPHLPDATVS